MLAAAFVPLLALTLSPTPASPAASRRHRHHRVAAAVERRAEPARAIGPDAHDPNALYSVRARRRFASYLRLRLLEIREAHLERAAEAIERRIPVDALVHGP